MKDGILDLTEFECVRKRDLETPSEVLLKRRLGPSVFTRRMARDHPQSATDREVFPMTKGHSTESSSSSFERKTMASSDKEQAVWPETPAADSLEIQIATIFLDTLVMRRTLSAHRGLQENKLKKRKTLVKHGDK
ncbi:hypothetical protein L596_000498 [Steinernema carpocapsae]|uniref:Uncharacterized protein n=1 Tax=Steinernema carpocapsae TaxID=34508 RepID=A0A4U8UI90_STECR|nr:hypothetical protein L596_000498 [Steinernema carpocapsae]